MPISSAHSGEKGNSAATGVALFVAGEFVVGEIVSVTVAVDEPAVMVESGTTRVSGG
ncbi:Uncharacterised protein [Yersinia enterocolitica]|nr:Uncharacterised protein [Yersinia enterocolitica]